MKLKLLVATILFVFFSCKKETIKEDNGIIARVSNFILVKEDLIDLVPFGTTKKDSIVIVNDFIDRWASQKLLYNAAEVNLSDEKQAELNNLVDQYKKDLYLKAYIEQLVYKSFDTIVSEQELSSYYEHNKEKFKTNTALVKLSYIQVNKNSLKLKLLSSNFAKGSKESKDVLKKNAIELKSYAFNDSIWIDMNQIYENFSFINIENKENYIVKDRIMKFTDSTDVFFIKTSNYIERNQVSPFQYIKPTLKNVILNKRKIELINKFQKDITKDALKDKKYEIYK
ncbi:hypothetical protein [uncultured Flavobacterium sp.]|uniref:hypothetical protein n=1 Tax=uncultured Flavobacterium sp. TaxID=165435 RepID=UPI0030CA4144